MASCPGSLLVTCSDLCTSLEIVTPSSVHQVRAWFTQRVAPPLDRALRDRLLIATAALTVHHVDPTTVSVNQGADPVWCTVGLLRHPMPVSGDTHGGDMTHSPVVGLLDIWDATHHVFWCCHRRPVSLPQCALFSQICGFNGAAGVPSPLTAPLLGSSTRGSSTPGLQHWCVPMSLLWAKSGTVLLPQHAVFQPVTVVRLAFSQSLDVLSSVDVLAQVSFLCEVCVPAEVFSLLLSEHVPSDSNRSCQGFSLS